MPTTITLQPTGQTVSVPTKWADVPLSRFLLLNGCAEPSDERSAAEVLLSLEAHALDHLLADDVHYLHTLLAFAQDPGDVLALLPTPDLPDVGQLPYGSLLLAQQVLTDNAERSWLASGPRILAIYRQTMLWGNADSAPRLAACEEALLAAPVTEVYADMAAFSTALRMHLSGTAPKRPTKTSAQMKRKKPILSRLFPSGSARS
jgi:hypothetical protein